MINAKYIKALSTKDEAYIEENKEGHLFRLHAAGEVKEVSLLLHSIRDVEAYYQRCSHGFIEKNRGTILHLFGDINRDPLKYTNPHS